MKITTYSAKLGLDISYFLKNSLWVSLTSGTNLFVAVILAQYLPKETYGQYQLILSILGLLSIFSVPGLNTSLVRTVARGFDGNYRDCVKLSFKYSLVAIPLLLGTGVWFWRYRSPEIGIGLIVSSLFFPFIYAPNTWRSFLQGKARFDLVSKWNFSQQIVTTMAYILIVVTASVNVLLFLIVSRMLLTSLFNIVWYSKSQQLLDNEIEDPDCVRYGVFLTKIQGWQMLATYFDMIIVGWLNVEVLAAYSIALKVFEVAKSSIKSPFAVTFNKFAQKDVVIDTKRSLILMIMGLGPLVILFVMSDKLFVVLFSDKYLDAAHLFRKLIFVIPLVVFNALFNSKVGAEQNKPRIILQSITIFCSIVIASAVFLLSRGNVDYFMISKIYSLQIAYFIVFIIPEKWVNYLFRFIDYPIFEKFLA